MINIAKHISNLRIQKFLEVFAKSNLNFLSTGPPSEAEIRETNEFYKSIAKKYHSAVDLHTLGLHRFWRNELVNNIEICQGARILDAPAGTGLNTLKVLQKSKQLKSEPDFVVTMFDMNPHMMKIGRDNFQRLGFDEKFVNYVEGDLHKLPFDAESFDIVITSLANRPYIDFSLIWTDKHKTKTCNQEIKKCINSEKATEKYNVTLDTNHSSLDRNCTCYLRKLEIDNKTRYQ